MTSMLRGGKNDGFGNLSYGGCSCHNNRAAHRKAKKSVKNKEKRSWKNEFSVR